MAHAKQRRGKRRRVGRTKKNRIKILLVFAAVCATAVFAGYYALMRSYVGKTENDRICEGIHIGVTDVSGMTADQAKGALQRQLDADGADVVTMSVEAKSATASLRDFGLSRKNTEDLIQEAMAYGKKGGTWKRYRQIKELENAPLVLKEEFQLNTAAGMNVLDEKAAPLAASAVDAVITKTAAGFELTPEKDGVGVDVENTLKKLTEYLNKEWKHENFSITVEVKPEKAKVTRADLEEIQDELGTFSTNAGGGERWQNLKNGVEKINGTVLMPGEELSVYDATGPYDAENGYVEAGSYENGKVVPAYGGGICQVSTTLYNAVLYAELDIVERYPHSMTVAYVEPSRDAAIAGDYLDFRFRNNQEAPVYIFGEIDANNMLRFTIYGKETRPAGRTVDFVSETVSSQDYGVTYKENPDADLGTMQYTGSPHVGKEARLWKVIYENGVEVSREIFNNSSYAKADQIVEIGTASFNAEASALVRNAIASQNASAIQDAVNQAYALISGSYSQGVAEQDPAQAEEEQSQAQQ